MLRWSHHRRLLTSTPRSRAVFPLIEVDEPNLMRDLFPYREICRVDFDRQSVMPDPAEEMFITDTTFRDGQQARAPYTPEQVVHLFGLLSKLGGPAGVIRQSEFFLYREDDREAVRRCQELDLRYPEITAWIRANPKDLQLVREMGLPEAGMLTSVSDYHIFLKLGWDRRQALENYLAVVKEALAHGIRPRCHFEDLTRADVYGFCVPFAIELMKLSDEARVPIKIRLCDTMGFGVPYEGAALPRSVQKLVRAMIDDAGVPGQQLEWHGHNDLHKVLINPATAWLYGCAGANGALLGFGERTGNTPVEGLIVEYIQLRGETNGIDTTVITDIRTYFERELGVVIPPNYPLVGKNFNVTSAGIHADGLIKNEEIYNIFDTLRILKRPVGVTITDKSGLAGIAHWVNSRLSLAGKQRIDKHHPGVQKIHKRVLKLYEDGRTTSMGEEEMEALATQYLPEHFVSEFDRLKHKVHEMAGLLVRELTRHDEIASMDPARIEAELRRFLDDHPSVQFAYVTNLEGRKVTHNITQIADKKKFETINLHMDFSDREWFIRPHETGEVCVTDYYTSRITGRLCITASAPVWLGDEMVGILGLDFKFEDMARFHAVEGPPPIHVDED
jgi:isopropylmalate/homocitrate/citramalate synthase